MASKLVGSGHEDLVIMDDSLLWIRMLNLVIVNASHSAYFFAAIVKGNYCEVYLLPSVHK